MSVKDKSAVMGKITSVYGVKGWVKVISYAQEKENLCNFNNWVLDNSGVISTVKVKSCKSHGGGLVAQLEGCDDRELAKQYCGSLVTIPQSELPDLEIGEYYWHQLEGMNVITTESVLLGKVSHLIETGSNDVLIVKKCKDSLDGKERLIPYLPDQVVQSVDLDSNVIKVDWDPDF
jgi:16S rRNA processing protein RimM